MLFKLQDEYGNHVYRNKKPLIHSDGTGEISEDLALMCPKNIYEGVCMNDKDVEVRLLVFSQFEKSVLSNLIIGIGERNFDILYYSTR